MKKLLALLTVTLLIGLNTIGIVHADEHEVETTANECDGDENFLVGQRPNSETDEPVYVCQELDPEEDTDEDGIPNSLDNCPLDKNGTDSEGDYNGDTSDDEDDEDAHQADNDRDGVGDECDAISRVDILEAAQNDAGLSQEAEEIESQAAYNASLDTLNACISTNNINHSTCNFSTFGSLNNNERAKFNRLYEALLNNEIITTLDEPISNQGIYRKARVCSTKFLRDINGVVQPTTSIDLYDPDLTEEELVSRFQQLRFLTTNDKCEEFFVQECNPSNNSSYTVGSQEDLPTRVFCSTVQIIFASSGSELIKNYVSLIYRLAAGLIGIIAVVVIIINGIIISASGGESGTIDNAKNRIVQSLVSLAILFLSGIILYSVNPNFFRTQNAQQFQETDTADVVEDLDETIEDSGGIVLPDELPSA